MSRKRRFKGHKAVICISTSAGSSSTSRGVFWFLLALDFTCDQFWPVPGCVASRDKKALVYVC